MNHQKIGPGLMCTLGDYESRGRSALALRARMMGISGVSGSQKEPRIVVFLRCDESERFDDLRGQGIVINEPDGKVRTAYVPVSDIDKLSQHPAVHRIGATRVAKPRLDVALPFTRVSNFRTTHSLNGSGVIIGSSIAASIPIIPILPVAFSVSGIRRLLVPGLPRRTLAWN
jgi:hypothetical protein